MNKDKIYNIVKIIKLGSAIDAIIEELFTKDGLTKEEALVILKDNVDFVNLIKSAYQLGFDAIKDSVENDGKIDFKDGLLPIIDITDDMILDALGSYLEKLLTPEVKDIEEKQEV